MTVHLADKITVPQLEQWLKSHTPAVVTQLKIQPTILDALSHAARAQSLLTDPRLDLLTGSLPSSTRGSIVQQEEELQAAIEKAAHQLQRSDVSETITDSIAQVESSAAALDDAMNCPTLLDLSTTTLDDISQGAQDCFPDLFDTVRLRQAILSRQTSFDLAAIPLTQLKYHTSVTSLEISMGKRFVFGTLNESAVFIEYLSSASSDCQPNQIARAASLLGLPKRSIFRTLVCVGYFHDASLESYGFVFTLPSSEESKRWADNPSNLTSLSLREAMRTPRYKRLPLGSRYRLAYSIILAIDAMHRVGWLHKGLNTEDIVFVLPKEDFEAESPSLPQPWLFGLQETRQSDSQSALAEDRRPEYAIFRHPERWGTPSKPFNETHDIHSLVNSSIEKARSDLG